MNLRKLKIQNYRSAKDLVIDIKDLHAIVGANNSGKSTILKAIDLLINPSTRKVDEETFWDKKTENVIRIEAIFEDLKEEEIDELEPYLKLNQSFHIARTVTFEPDDQSEDFDNGKVKISQHYCKQVPNYNWLIESEISGKSISEWWNIKDDLVVDGNSFVDHVGGSKPNVGEWKEFAKSFINEYLSKGDFKTSWFDNPKGYSGVLQGSLPNFVFIPAVKHVTDEAKVTNTTPFGILLNQLIEKISDVQKGEVDNLLGDLKSKLNRSGGDDRFGSINEIEKSLNSVLASYMSVDLEIEFETPTLQSLISSPKLLADDGFRNSVENKGHGLQRAIIFSILQSYSDLISDLDSDYTKNTIFGIEEPEIYMHPQAQRNIRNVFKEITDGNDQLFFTTHSSNLIDVTYFDEIIRVEALNEDDSIKSKIWQLSVKELVDDEVARHPHLEGKVTEDSIRGHYSHAYHPSRSEGFFANKVILVEGPTEQYALPVYAKSMNHNLERENIGIVDCGGKGQIDRLYRVFNELGIPCYIIFDYDKNNDKPNIINKSIELLSLVEESTEAPENVLISDRITCFPESLEKHIYEDIDEIEDLSKEARKFLGLKSDSGKPLVARFIARRLTESDEPTIPDVISNILDNAVQVEWVKSCLSNQ